MRCRNRAVPFVYAPLERLMAELSECFEKEREAKFPFRIFYIPKIYRFVSSHDVWGTIGSKKTGSLVILDARMTVFTFSDLKQIKRVFYSLFDYWDEIYEELETMGIKRPHHVGKVKYSWIQVDPVDFINMTNMDLWNFDLFYEQDHILHKEKSYEMVYIEKYKKEVNK